jgi:hypothetical protein
MFFVQILYEEQFNNGFALYRLYSFVTDIVKS